MFTDCETLTGYCKDARGDILRMPADKYRSEWMLRRLEWLTENRFPASADIGVYSPVGTRICWGHCWAVGSLDGKTVYTIQICGHILDDEYYKLERLATNISSFICESSYDFYIDEISIKIRDSI